MPEHATNCRACSFLSSHSRGNDPELTTLTTAALRIPSLYHRVSLTAWTVHGRAMHSTTTLTKTHTKSSRSLSSAPIILTLDNDVGRDVEHDSFVGDLLSPPSPTRHRGTRALRRKKHLSIYRASAPAQSPIAEVAIEIPFVPRPVSMISPPSVVDECPASYPTKLQTHNRSHSQPNVRLGHPSRPYYSAIRKNMSRPNSSCEDSSTNSSRPTSLAYPSRATSPTFGYLPQTFEDTDDDETPNASRAASPSAFPFNLDSSFQFQETGKLQNSVHDRVKKLGKGLKDLVRRRQHA
ncbi:hypothetical protein K438DRAFT_1799694 [Mycena galopus ATCC 62051]|nr:hypothetical protein K438DRAFT_1799694 [Mycena galopus ATCC 62051]